MKKIKHFLLTKSVGLYINTLSFINSDKANTLAYKLFSEPRKGKLKKEELPKVLQNAKSEAVQFKEHSIQTYIWEGNENIILLVHGWESNASRWEKLLPHLRKKGSTIIALDAPAHGLSSGIEFNVPKYAEFINFIINIYSPKILISHSIGGAASVYSLYKYSNKTVEKLILLGAPSEMKIIVSNYIAMLSLNKKINSFLEKQSEVKFNIKIDDFSAHLFSKNLNQKALIAHDIDDPVVLVSEGRKIANALPSATYIETQGLGHSMHDTKLYQSIVEFIHH
jgi:predicted alpha/beta hydrolase family esterase